MTRLRRLSLLAGGATAIAVTPGVVRPPTALAAPVLWFSSSSSSSSTPTPTPTTTTTTTTPNNVVELPSVTIYQYAICPFCCKVKAVLDYLQVPYTTVEVDPMSKAQIKFSKDGYRKVPISVVDGTQVNDSKAIVDDVLTRIEAAAATRPELAARLAALNAHSSDAEKWHEWVNTKLATLLFPNICRNAGEAMEAFGYVNDVKEWPWHRRAVLHVAGGLAMR
jgi:microsomal prostaglandin-E synthase 2